MSKVHKIVCTLGLVLMLVGCQANQADLETLPSLTYSVGVSDNFNETEFAKHLCQKTGVKIDFIRTYTFEQLKILESSNQLPDIIELDWSAYPGGVEKASKDGLIIELNDLVETTAPNLLSFLQQNPDIDKKVRTDTWKYYSFPFLREDESMNVYQGPIVRMDWLEQCDLDIPVTMDEWTVMLRAFKEKMGASAPLTMDNTLLVSGVLFSGAYGMTRSFYLEDDTVKFGPMQDGYRDYVSQLRDWYSEGLLDNGFPNTRESEVEIKMITGQAGATAQSAGAALGKWMKMVSDDSSFNLVGVPYPVLNHGQRPKFSQYDYSRNGAAISTDCKDAGLAAKFLDYGYSEEGKLLYNFGIQGESYNMVDGRPVYTDMILKNPSYPVATIMAKYIRGNTTGPFIQMKEYQTQYYTLSQERDAVAVWSDTDAKTYALPPVTFLQEESQEITKLSSQINREVEDWYYKFILGLEPLEQFQQYQNSLENIGVDRLLEIYQQAYERYKRK